MIDDATPTPERPTRRSRRRLLLWVAAAIVYAAIMWYWVFPWVDRTFVNRPTL